MITGGEDGPGSMLGRDLGVESWEEEDAWNGSGWNAEDRGSHDRDRRRSWTTTQSGWLSDRQLRNFNMADVGTAATVEEGRWVGSKA